LILIGGEILAAKGQIWVCQVRIEDFIKLVMKKEFLSTENQEGNKIKRKECFQAIKKVQKLSIF